VLQEKTAQLQIIMPEASEKVIQFKACAATHANMIKLNKSSKYAYHYQDEPAIASIFSKLHKIKEYNQWAF